MKFILYNTPDISWEEKLTDLKKEFPDVEFINQEDSTEYDIKTAHAFVGIMPLKHFQNAGELKIIFVHFTGPNMLPFEDMRNRGVRLSNTHGNARFVAERAIAMTLTFLGKIIEYHTDLKNNKWHGIWAEHGLQDTWDTLWEKRCAVIGTGEIGKWIARYLKTFNCHVTGFKKRELNFLPEYFDEITFELTEALEKSEIVFITLPLTKETEGMFSREILSGMQGKFLVNVGRGSIVDEEGLYDALKSGIIRGAAIDVWYSYPERGKGSGMPSRYPFHELENVILSPHVAGYVQEAILVNIEQTTENIRTYLKTGSPRFELNLELMY